MLACVVLWCEHVPPVGVVRLSGELDMLDAPGVIPASFGDQVGDGRDVSLREMWHTGLRKFWVRFCGYGRRGALVQGGQY